VTVTAPIVVLGATGQQGGATARHLLASGAAVRILVRDPDKPEALALAAAGVEVVAGDMLEPETLRRGFEGARGVFSVMTWRGPGGVDAERQAGFNVADAAAEAGVAHLVYTSVASADLAPGVAHFESKREIELHIAALGVPATILRPVFFMDNFRWQAAGIREGRLVQGIQPETPLQMIAVDDIGGIAALVFGAPEKWIGWTIELAGDELTMVEAAAVFSARLGRPVEYSAEHENRPGGGEEARKMAEWFDEVGYQVDIAEVRAMYPRLKDFATFVAGAVWLEG
jgi:uncharacterized protein YbjT (DUF2867 family)